MKNLITPILVLLLFPFAEALVAQVAINNTAIDPDGSAMLDISSNEKGILIPRMTAAQKEGISSPAEGLMVFQTDATAGYYYYDGSSWAAVSDGTVPYSGIIYSQTESNTYLESAGFSLIGKINQTYDSLGLTEAWTDLTSATPADTRWWYTSVWTGSELIIWGGVYAGYVNTGLRYNLTTDTWASISTVNAPSGRIQHSAVWTGTEMIVWGGNNGVATNTGGRYNPITDTWTTMSTTNAPTGRALHTAIWADSKMIIWGGGETDFAYYDPLTDVWTTASTLNAPPTAASESSVVWTGTEMIVFGGEGLSGGYAMSTGGSYDLATDTWTLCSTSGAPGTKGHAAVWADSIMIVFGGNDGLGGALMTTNKYNPLTDTWTALSAAPASGEASANFDGTNTIYATNFGASPSKYEISSDTWTILPTLDAPTNARSSTVWTGTSFIIWGGIDAGTGDPLETGSVLEFTSNYTTTSQELYLFQKE